MQIKKISAAIKIFNLSLKAKIIIFILFIMVLPFVLVMLFLLNSLADTSYNVEQKALNQTMLLVEQDLLANIASKAQIVDLTLKNSIIDIDDLKEKIIENGFAEKMLRDFYYKHQEVANVFFVDIGHSVFIAPAVENLTQIAKISSSSHYEIFNLINDENEKTYTGKWLSPRLGFNGQKKIIPYILPVWKSDKIIGVVGIEISTDSFFSEIVRIDPSKSSYIFIAKSDGSFFSSSDKVYDDFQIDDKENGNFLDSRVIRKQGLENILSNVGKKEGTIKFTKKNTKSEFIVNYSTISSLGGKIFVVTPLEEILQIQAEKAQEIQQAVSKVGITGLLYVAGLTIFIIIVSYFLSNRTIINPIFVLQAGIESIEKNLDTKISVKNEDEFGRLAKSFNKMSENLKESRRELEKYSSDLEGLVAQRTSELEKSKQDMISKLEDLEKFNKVAVDRELKMIELKTKIKELEAQKQENTETQKQ